MVYIDTDQRARRVIAKYDTYYTLHPFVTSSESTEGLSERGR
jgi:hypothetical protein